MHETEATTMTSLPREEGGRRRVPQAVDLVVDRAVLLDVRVAGRDVGLGLVVVVVADEVLHPVVGEELPELVRKLRGERFVGRDDQGGLLDLLDRPRHRGALAGPGDAEQRLVPVAAVDPLGQLRDRLRLVASRRELRDNLEFRHPHESKEGVRH